MMVRLLARLGANRRSGLKVDRAYRVYDGADGDGRVLVLDDDSDPATPRWITPVEYEEVPDPFDPHDLVRLQPRPGGGWEAICSCPFRWHLPEADPDEAAHGHGLHHRHMHAQRVLAAQLLDPDLADAMARWRCTLRRPGAAGEVGP
jgi:hypothetical protein